MTIQRQVGQGEFSSNQLKLSLQHALNALQFRRQAELGLGLGLGAFGASGLALVSGRLGLLGSSFGFGGSFLFLGAHNLLQAERKSAASFGGDEGQGEESDPRHSFLIDGGEEAVEAEGVLASFGDDDFIASQDVDIVGLEVMVAKEEPEDMWPGEDSSEEALDGAIAGAVAAPAGDASHGDATGHGQKSESDAAEVGKRGSGESRLEAGEQC